MASEIAERLAEKWASRACEEGECADEIAAVIDAAVLAEREACELVALRVRDAHRGPQGQSMSSMQRNIDMAKAASLIATTIRARNKGVNDGE